MAGLVFHLMPDEPEAAGLLALLVLTQSRRVARVQADRLVSLDEQDRSLWGADLIAEGHALVRACLRRGRPGPFQIQAAINAVHTDAATAADTDWSQVLALYDQLYAVTPTPVVGLNRAIAMGQLKGATAGLAALDAVPGMEALAAYHPLHATRAELLRRAGQGARARATYDRALGLVTNPAERALLAGRRDAL